MRPPRPWTRRSCDWASAATSPHMVVALSRALGMPARYVSGYALGLEPFDFHAFAQVYVGGRWYNVDATYDTVRPALIPIAVGATPPTSTW